MPFQDQAAAALVLILCLLSLWQWMQIAISRASGANWSTFQPRLPVPWNGLDVGFLAICWILLEGFLVGSILGAPDHTPGKLTVQGLLARDVAHIVWLAVALLYLVRKSGALADDLGLETSHFVTDVWQGGKTFLAALLPAYGIQWVVIKRVAESKHPLVRMVEEDGSMLGLVVATLSAVVLVPFFEEFLFRVLLQGWLEKKESLAREAGRLRFIAPGVLSIAASALVFGALHPWPDQIAVFVLGLFFGYAYRQSHRIYASLVAHMGINALAMLQLWLITLYGE